MKKSKFKHFKRQPIKLLSKYERWKKTAEKLKLSKEAKQRLNWIIYYYEKSNKNASLTCRHYGISRKTFYKWFNQFDENNLCTLKNLENKSKVPKKFRQREITPTQEQRIIELRNKYIRYGKLKLQKIYQNKYDETISSWQIQKVIEDKKLYHNPIKTAKITKKRLEVQKKKRITELKLNKLSFYKKTAGYIICLDTIVIHWNKCKRYIFTAIDKYGKIAYARMYKNKSSKSGEDFLYRLHFLLDGNIPRVGHDNGTEFEQYFKQACEKLNIEQYYSRVRTPKDNPNNERFNRTLQEEFIQLGNFTTDVDKFNENLTEWLVEYNFHRPHQALNYQTPIEVSKVLPMYSSCTVV